MDWGDLVARARGLSTHLLGGARLRALGPDAVFAEEEARSGTAARLAVLLRRAGDRAMALTVLFDDEDRRAIRALVRGAIAGTPAVERTAGLVPTPALPARLLAELAAQPTAAAVAALLIAHGHPSGPALLPEAQRERPHLLAIEAKLDRLFAERATRGARRGDRALRAHVTLVIDMQNASTAVIGAGELPPQGVLLFLPGGRRVRRALFDRALAARDREEAAVVLSAPFGKTPLGAALRARAAPAALDDAAAATGLAAGHRAARREPLGTAPIIWYVLRERAEARDLRRLALGSAMHAPWVRLARDVLSP